MGNKFLRVVSLIALLLGVNTISKAQYDTTFGFQKIYNVDSQRQDVIYSAVKRYMKESPKDFLFYEDRIAEEDKKWIYGRAVWSKGDDEPLNGFKSADKETKKVKGKCVFMYNGAIYECVQVFIITADVVVYCKDGRIKIDVEKLHYCHVNNGAPPYKRKVKGSPAEGPLEDLWEHKFCSSSKADLFNFINTASHNMISRIYKGTLNELDDNW